MCIQEVHACMGIAVTNVLSGFILILGKIVKINAYVCMYVYIHHILIQLFFLFIFQIFVPLATTVVCYFVIAYAVPNTEISFIAAPLIFTWLLAYFVSSMFSEIFRYIYIYICIIIYAQIYIYIYKYVDKNLCRHLLILLFNIVIETILCLSICKFIYKCNFIHISKYKNLYVLIY
jgi:hypothetical protein